MILKYLAAATLDIVSYSVMFWVLLWFGSIVSVITEPSVSTAVWLAVICTIIDGAITAWALRSRTNTADETPQS